MPEPQAEDLLRACAPRVLGVLARRFADVHATEDAVQEALLAASVQWPRDGVPDDPQGWLVRVATRRMIDGIRSEHARARREQLVATQVPTVLQAPVPGVDDDPGHVDDSLVLLFLCCHPALTTASAVALTLRAVGGLTTAEVAAAFLVPERTMAQRISRAKAALRDLGEPFALPERRNWNGRLDAVLHVLYVMFTEGHTSAAGCALRRPDVAGEAVRLARMLRTGLPDDPEAAGLLALMVLTAARDPARTGPDGELVPLHEQDRSRWDRDLIAEGVHLVTEALPRGRVGSYQVQAAIAALHNEAPDVAATDWRQIAALYQVLERLAPTPVVTLNRAVATAMVDGPEAGLALLRAVEGDRRIAAGHRLPTVRGHLMEMLGRHAEAVDQYRLAAARATNTRERDYLVLRAARLASQSQ